MARVLGVGIATLDIINYLDKYPAEDSEVRADAQQVSRGGNATNTLVVLSQLGEQCDWCGVLADDPGSLVIRQDLEANGVNYHTCQTFQGGTTPTSYIILSRERGSRSIVHYRDLPELDVETFRRCELSQYAWVHFEGRAVEETLTMLRYVKQQYPHLRCSLEVEKPREGIEQLFGEPDLLLFSRHYAEEKGFASAQQLLTSVGPRAPQAMLVCAWGSEGAYALDNNNILHIPAFIQPQVIDSLGAGDTFNAGMIHNLLQNQPLGQALQNSCRLAGLKCSQQGFAGLAERYQQIRD